MDNPRFIRIVSFSIVILVVLHYLVKNLLNEPIYTPIKGKETFQDQSDNQQEQSQESVGIDEGSIQELRDYLNQTALIDTNFGSPGYNQYANNLNMADFPDDQTNLSHFFKTDTTRRDYLDNWPGTEPKIEMKPSGVYQPPNVVPSNSHNLPHMIEPMMEKTGMNRDAYKRTQWEYQEKNVMNGSSPFFNSVMGYDDKGENYPVYIDF